MAAVGCVIHPVSEGGGNETKSCESHVDLFVIWPNVMCILDKLIFQEIPLISVIIGYQPLQEFNLSSSYWTFRPLVVCMYEDVKGMDVRIRFLVFNVGGKISAWRNIHISLDKS